MSVDIYISEKKIKERIREMGKEITVHYQDKDLVVVCILTGAFVFCADLLREIKVPIQRVEFISISSYGDGKVSSGNIRTYLDVKQDIAGKDILLIEDIVDTGLTMKSLLETFSRRNTRSIKLASLLYKPSRNIHAVPIDFLGFKIDDEFVVGYGLDFAGEYRELPYIGIYRG